MNVSIESEQKWDALDGILKLLQDSHWHTVREIKEGIWLPEEKLATILRFFVDFDLIDYANGKSRVKIMPSGLSVLRLPSEYKSEFNIPVGHRLEVQGRFFSKILIFFGFISKTEYF